MSSRSVLVAARVIGERALERCHAYVEDLQSRTEFQLQLQERRDLIVDVAERCGGPWTPELLAQPFPPRWSVVDAPKVGRGGAAAGSAAPLAGPADEVLA